MRIGLAADTYKPYISGVTIYIESLMKALRDRGHEVRLFTFSSKKTVDQSEDYVFYSPGFALKNGYSVGFGYQEQAVSAIRDIDIWHIHHPFLSGWLAKRYASHLPQVFTAHTRYDLFSEDYLPGLTRRAGLRWISAYMRPFCQRMAAVICNSAASEEGLRRLGIDRELRRIPNGIDLSLFERATRRTGFIKGADLRAKKVLLFLGRLAAEKNLMMLVNAFHLVSRQNTDAHLVIAGVGNYRSELEKRIRALDISARVMFTGAIPHAEVAGLFAEADGFVMPSTKDTHPLSLIEAMAAGVVPLVADSPAYQDLVENGVNGLVVEAKADCFAQAMARLLQQPDERVRMASASRTKAGQFSIDNTAARMEKVYDDALRSHVRT